MTHTNISSQIKKELIEKLLTSDLINHQLLISNNQSAELGRACAAILVGVINYGYNVANRSELRAPISSPSDLLLESAISILGSIHSGRYLRSENNHPSRQVYQSIIGLLKLPTLDRHIELKKQILHQCLESILIDRVNKKQIIADFYKLTYDKFISKYAIEDVKQKNSIDSLKVDYISISDDSNKNKIINQFNRLLNQYISQSPKKENIKDRQCIISNLISTLDSIKLKIITAYERYNINVNLSDISLIEALLKQDIVYLFSSKADGSHAYWLGQWKSPEEVMENLFAKLTFNEIKLLSNKLLKEELDKFKGDSDFYMWPDSHLNLDERDVSTDLSIGDIGDTDNISISIDLTGRLDGVHINVFNRIDQLGTFSNVMEQRLKIIKDAARIINTTVTSKLIDVEAPKTDYPCVIFDLRKLINHLRHQSDTNPLLEASLVFEDHQVSSSTISSLNHLLLSYFAGIVNRESIKAYGHDYIELQPQGSFGSLRPTITDTGYSFRLSLGLVPSTYTAILASAYKDFIEEISEDKTLSSLLSFLANEIDISRQNARNKAPNILSQNQVRICIADLSSIGITLAEICKKLSTVQNVKDFVKEVEQMISERNNNIITEKSQIDSKAPDGLVAIYSNLCNLYANNKDKFQIINNNLFLKSLDELIDLVISIENRSKNYSIITTKIESLCRLLKLRGELEIFERRYQRLNTELDENSSQKKSTDLVLTNDGITIATASRGGMAAFTRIVEIINNVYSSLGNSYQGNMAEIYFEIDSNTPQEIYDMHSHLSGENYHGKWLLDEEEITANTEIKLADIAQFPRHRTGESKPTIWKEDWSKINEQIRPEVLVIDISSAQQKDFDHLYKEFERSGSNQKPYAMILFASDNKFGQSGVDLVSMGDLRLVTKSFNGNNNRAHQLINNLRKAFEDVYNQQEENTTATKAYRKLQDNIKARRSSKRKASSLQPSSLFHESGEPESKKQKVEFSF
ncbi:MAG: hypothetical protein EP298_11210 [Gammaproteobacteria bacterium]|nr:MAG: hypothetical protein EP298_11210 [Gammaproteobacteria bacterium]UTW43186.1 hypothetical protein KFE69_03310 [bacterium SCSIO 12844]